MGGCIRIIDHLHGMGIISNSRGRLRRIVTLSSSDLIADPMGCIAFERRRRQSTDGGGEGVDMGLSGAGAGLPDAGGMRSYSTRSYQDSLPPDRGCAVKNFRPRRPPAPPSLSRPPSPSSAPRISRSRPALVVPVSSAISSSFPSFFLRSRSVHRSCLSVYFSPHISLDIIISSVSLLPLWHTILYHTHISIMSFSFFVPHS
ncbi:hypothetical protein B0H12DRAFT_1122532 [Mycena haematopus]|nr:hypothetical protein B0H12DRAFT_1122532 [Mycena haematopus]